MTAQVNLLLAQRQGFASRHSDLPGHQVLASDHLGYRMLDLQPGVHFQEVELAVIGQQKLHSASALIIHRSCSRQGSIAHGFAQLWADGGAGRFFNDFAMATLHRAIALAEKNQVAMAVAEDLHLDMSRIDQRLLQNQLR